MYGKQACFRARYYMPEMRRFISADTIVPGPSNPLAYNRYAYSVNSPLNYTDPSGHAPVACLENCNDYSDVQGQTTELTVIEAFSNHYDWVLDMYGVSMDFSGAGLSAKEALSARKEALRAVQQMGRTLFELDGGENFSTVYEAFTTVFGESNTFVIVEDMGTVSGICEGIYGCNDADSTNIYLQADALLGERSIRDLGGTPSQFVAHELAHNFTNEGVGDFLFRPESPDPDVQPSSSTTMEWLEAHALFGVGCYAYCGGLVAGEGYDDEMTADAIANYLMVQADDDTGQLSAFISTIVTCRVGGECP